MQSSRLWQILTTLLLLGSGALILAPLVVVVLAAVSPAVTSGGAFQLPDRLTFDNFVAAWQQGNFLLAFANSTIVALAVTAAQIFTSALAGYALARFDFWGRKPLLLFIIATLVIPFQLLVIPIFLVLKWGHLLNTYAALILPTAANGFGIFLMRQFFLGIPIELEQAASLDGANRLAILWRIVLPLSRSAIVTLFLFTFIGEWNDLFKPLIFTTRPELRTVQLALAEFQEQFTNSWQLLMAAITIATIPIIILFLFGQKQFIRGIASTGIKS
jgi:multiple sugar transport system permease protein